MGRDELIQNYDDSHLNINISAGSLLKFDIAGDRPGTYLNASINETGYDSYSQFTEYSTEIYWPLDEIDQNTCLDGLDVCDLSKTNSNGTFNGTYSNNANYPGKIGTSWYFNGTNNRINVNTSGIQTVHTTEFWFYGKHTSNGNYYILDMGGNNNWVQLYDTDGDSKMEIRAGSSGYLNSNYEYEPNKWTHVAVVADGSKLLLYINGKLDTSGTITLQKPNGLNIGSYFSGGYWFNGYIDEVRISRDVRTPEEIRAAYEYGKRTHPITISFGASLDSSNLIANSSDTQFIVDETTLVEQNR